MQDEPEGGECFQHKMSLKMIRTEQGTMRVKASHQAACRTSHPGRDAGVSQRQQQSQLRRHRASADLWLGRRRLARSKVPGSVEKGQRNRAPLSGQDQRTQQSANHPFDRPLARARRHRAASLAAPPLPTPFIRPPISSCWPRPMALTKASRRRPCAASSSANSRSIARPNTNDWPRSRPLLSTTCGAPGPIANTLSITPRPAPRR